MIDRTATPRPATCKPEASLSGRSVAWLGAAAALTWLAVFFGRGVVPLLVSDYFHRLPPNPYMHAADGLRLYVFLPSVVISSIAFLMWPGFFLTLAWGRPRRWTEAWVVSFGASYAALLAVGGAFKALSDAPFAGDRFVAVVGATTALTWMILAAKTRRGRRIPSPFVSTVDRRRLGWTVAIAVLFLLATLPAILWEDMNDDGFEALEIGRSLDTEMLPRFPTPAGVYASSFGMVSMAYPAHWFVAVFGPVEPAVRLPILLYLGLLFCVLVELIEWKSPRPLGAAGEAVLCLSIATYAVTMSYSAGYDSYFADMAAPAAFETLTIVCILAALYFLWQASTGWFLFFSLLAYFCRPTGLLVLLLAAGAAWLTRHPDRRAWLWRIGAAVVVCVLAAVLYDNVHASQVLARSGAELPTQSAAGRFRFLRFDDFGRLLWVLFPTGVLPFLSLLAFRWQDSYARFLSVVSLAYFALFYIQAFVALHHFVPVMILPVVVFWRTYLLHEPRISAAGLERVAWASMIGAGFVALWLSLPRHFEINRTVRAIGQTIELRVGDYDDDFLTQVRHRDLLFELFRPDWEVDDPATELVTGYLSVIYYATRPKLPEATIHYVVQDSAQPAPPGFLPVARGEGAVAYARSTRQWDDDRRRAGDPRYRSVLYDAPRTTLFRHWGQPAGGYDIDIKGLVLAAQELVGVELVRE